MPASAAEKLDFGISYPSVGLSLQAGALIARRYRLSRPLGQGGMGTVWAANHTLTGREVAMKFVHGRAHSGRELRERFLREARAATAVRHPNVVHVLDAFELDDETRVMVMDLLHGETLRERLDRDEQLSLSETAAVLLPAISAVGTAHARGIVHRDLKPENIFLANEAGDGATIKVLDFGIAKLTSGGGGAEGAGLVTQAGSTLGTPCYMAPEQATGETDVDHGADIWAFGVILYECLSGVRPIDGESVGQVVMRLMSTGIIPLERVVLGLPPDVTELVGRMLSRERSRRPRDLCEVAELLRRYSKVEVPAFGEPESEIDGAAPSAEPFLASAPPPARSRTRLVRTGLFAAAVAFALGVGAWVLRGSATEAPRAAESAAPVAPITKTRASASAPPPPLASVAAPAPSRPPAPASSRPRRPPVARHTVPAPATPAPSASLQGLAETPPF
jgi:eukaryotic-like serine/threonine-protein kinase